MTRESWRRAAVATLFGSGATAVITLVALAIYVRRLDHALPAEGDAPPVAGTARQAAPIAVLACGAAVGAFGVPISWSAVLVAGALIGAGGSVGLWWMMPAGAVTIWRR